MQVGRSDAILVGGRIPGRGMAAKVAAAFFGVYRDGLEQRLRTGAAAADVKKN